MPRERSIDAPIVTLARNLLPDRAVGEADFVIGAAGGSLQGLIFEITENAANNGGTPVAGARISSIIDELLIKDRAGRVTVQLTGRQLERVANALAPFGSDHDSPAPGDGMEVAWRRLIPISIYEADLPGICSIQWGAAARLYQAAARPVVAASISLRADMVREPVDDTLRVFSATPNLNAGVNDVSHLLPDGLWLERLILAPNDYGDDPMDDSDILGVTLQHEGVLLLDGATMANRFEPEDREIRRDGHNPGVAILRVPAFRKNETTRLRINFRRAGTDMDMLMVTRAGEGY